MKRLQRAQWLATIVLLLTVVLLVGLLGRVVWIQRHVTQDSLYRLARQYEAVESIPAGRGEIRMGDSTPVAVSVRMYNLFADPAFIADPSGLWPKIRKLQSDLDTAPEVDKPLIMAQIDKLQKQMDSKADQVETARKTLSEVLAPLLNRSATEIRQELQSKETLENGQPRRFLWLAREVDESFYKRFFEAKAKLQEVAQQSTKNIRDITDKQLREEARQKAATLYHALDGVGFQTSIRRVYPLGPLAGQVIGIANRYEGVEAMEYQLDPLLGGRLGQMVLMKDAARHTLLIEDKGYRPPDHGCNVWLTLDTVIQNIAEDELGKACEEHHAESGCAVLMDPMTGRVLAMASWPTFDPNNYQQNSAAAKRNRAFEPYEPGSIFKPFVLAWAIEKKIVRPSDIFDCHFGHWNDPTGRAVTDHSGYGAMSAADILIKSSNIGMAEIGWRMGIPTLYEAVKRFDFGERTGVEAPGDEKGIVKPLAQWNKGTLTSASFGYEVAATPLQLVRGFATFANNGYLITPRLVHAVEIAPGQVVSWEDLAGPPMERQVLSPQTVLTMRNIMEGVFITGTAKGVTSKVYRMFGKTGTAHLAIHGAGHYAADQYNSSFLAGGPMTNPQLVAIVTLHKPQGAYYGATVAAPACTQMLERALLYQQVPPDQTAGPRRTDPLAHFR